MLSVLIRFSQRCKIRWYTTRIILSARNVHSVYYLLPLRYEQEMHAIYERMLQ